MNAQSEIPDFDDSLGDALIDPHTGPYSPRAEIEAEIKLIEAMPRTRGRYFTLQTMRSWLED